MPTDHPQLTRSPKAMKSFPDVESLDLLKELR